MRFIIALGLTLMLAGCSWLDPATNVLEEISPTILLYLDAGGSGEEAESTIVLPAVKNEKKQVLTARGWSLKEHRQKLTFGHSREFKSGQLRMLFFSEELARRGIIRHLNTMLLDQEISNRLYMAVVRGDFAGFLREQILLQKNYDRILYKMFRHYENMMTVQNLHMFLKDYYSSYADPNLPLFAVRGDQLVYTGTALFRDDRMVADVPAEMDCFFQMVDSEHGSFPTVPMPGLEVVLGKVTTSREISYDDKRGVVITLHVEGQVDEYAGDKNLGDRREAEQFIRDVKEELEERVRGLIRSWQKLSIDPARIGLSTLTPFRERFPGGEWRRRWPEIPVTVRVDLGLTNLGMIKPVD
ncbi:MAG TPA: Ger(x)C family spore germination C-terminal domain-containing protein [Paenibacillaceae bacterium]